MSDIAFRFLDRHERLRQSTYQHRYQCGFTAQFAMDLIRSGVFSAIDDGEDSAGRQRHRMLTPDELVERCMTIAELTFEQLAERGHVVELPDIEQFVEGEGDNGVGFAPGGSPWKPNVKNA